MELKPNMYVRTKNEIVQIDKISNGVMEDTKGHLHFGDFIKASHNIIDLIEVGDYVNGELVLEKVLYGNNAGVKVFGDTYFDDEIQSIVTKEQFSAMEYKID